MRKSGEWLEKKSRVEKYIEHVFNELENVHLVLFSNEQSLYSREADGDFFFLFFQFVVNLLKEPHFIFYFYQER